MTRSLIYSALVLHVRASGEANREASFLTAEEGLIRATVFGGPKSKLRAFVSPFHQGTLYVYHDPVKDRWKVTDFDVQGWRPALRERYERLMTAGAIAGTVLATHGGGGNWADALALASGALDALAHDDASGDVCQRIFVHFLWNWTALLGERPSVQQCAICGAAFEGAAFYVPREAAFLCAACSGAAQGGRVAMGAGARKWLVAVEALPAALLPRWSLDAVALQQVRAAGTALMADILGRRPASWDF